MLLIFLMVSTTFKSELGLELELPETETGGKQRQDEDLVVLVDADGGLYYGQRPVDLEELATQLGSAIATASRKKVVIRADRDARHGVVVQVMDIARRSGATGVIVAGREK